ncbi:MAG: hypothetical protein HY741_01395 [Chloroflexi bacterium]|nr:hypothetical protein [Chloroflexota bacterium]
METFESEFPALWEILRATNDPQDRTVLTCDECFAIMEYLADCAVAGAKREAIFAAAQKHLARCPDCRIEHAERIQALEKLSRQSKE